MDRKKSFSVKLDSRTEKIVRELAKSERRAIKTVIALAVEAYAKVKRG